MTPRNRKRCHSRATAKGRYLSAPLGIPQSTNLAPTPGGGVGLSNPRIFDDFFPKLGLIASISSQVPKNMRLIPHISTNYDTMNNCEQLWTALKHISRENLPGSCERPWGENAFPETSASRWCRAPRATNSWKKRRLKNLKIISWDDMRCTNSLLQHHCHCWTKFWIILNRGPLYSIHKGMWNCIAVLSSDNVA